MILAARLILFGVFTITGLAKLRDRTGAREAARGFGAPAWVGGVLPFAELATAGMLLPRTTAVAGAIAAAALLAAFCAGITRAMARGEAPDCHCFGVLHSEPAGARTLARNIALLAVAASTIAAGPGPSAVAWVGDCAAPPSHWRSSSAAAAVALAAQSAFLLALLRQNGRILKRLDALESDAEPPAWDDAGAGLPVGLPAPAFELPGLTGCPSPSTQVRTRTSGAAALHRIRPAGPCTRCCPRPAAGAASVVDSRVVSRGGAEAKRAKAQDAVARCCSKRTARWQPPTPAPPRPQAVLVDPAGRIAQPAAPGAEAIRALLETATPSALRGLDGEHVDLAGRVLLFWNPGCGFCTAMLEDLREWERDVPELILISTGTEAENRALELNAPIVLDPGFTIAPRYAVSGTPSAVRLDPFGKAVAPPAVGAQPCSCSRARVKGSMAVNTTVQVTMPAMGESVTEGTVLEWHKKEGDPVDLDEVLVEISTDKVDAEVPSPIAGTVVKVLAGEGDTVEVGQLLCEIESEQRRGARGGGRRQWRAPGRARSRRRPAARSSTSSPRPAASRSPRARSSSGR